MKKHIGSLKTYLDSPAWKMAVARTKIAHLPKVNDIARNCEVMKARATVRAMLWNKR